MEDTTVDQGKYLYPKPEEGEPIPGGPISCELKYLEQCHQCEIKGCKAPRIMSVKCEALGVSIEVCWEHFHKTGAVMDIYAMERINLVRRQVKQLFSNLGE